MNRIMKYEQDSRLNGIRFKDIIVNTAVITVAFFERGRITDSSSSLGSSSFIVSFFVAVFLFVSSKYTNIKLQTISLHLNRLRLCGEVELLVSLDVVSVPITVEALWNSSA